MNSGNSKTIIEIKHLGFSYGENTVLRDINLTVPRGKVVAILGTSGCGKSTLLRLIGGQLRPDAGRIEVDGQFVHAMDDEALYAMRRKMGMMFQKSGLFSDLSTFENIAFPMRERTKLPEPVISNVGLRIIMPNVSICRSFAFKSNRGTSILSLA